MIRNRFVSAVCLLAVSLMAAPPAFPQSNKEQGSVPRLIFTNKAAFEAVLDTLAPGSRRNINWDGIPILGQGTVNISPDFFLASRQIILDPSVPPAELLVSNDGFGDVNGNYPANFPFFSPTINFKYKEDDGQPNVFRLADLTTPGQINAFGAIFTDVEKAGLSGLEFFDSEGHTIDKFLLPAGHNGQHIFLGVIYAKPIVARVDVLMGENGADFGDVEDVSDGGTSDVVVVDDFVFQAATTPVATVTSAHIAPTGSLKITGLGFQVGSLILLNGQPQVTRNNRLSPATRLSSKTAGALINPGQTVTLQVVNPDGTRSEPFSFTR